MSKINECRIDPIQNQIIVSKRFLKAAGILSSTEYQTLQQARMENPGFEVVAREIKKPDTKNTYRNLNFKNMELFIRNSCGEGSREMKEFVRVKELAKVQTGPYAYVKTWFLKKFPNYREYSETMLETTADKSQLSVVPNG